MESVEDMVDRLDSMASGEPSWDLSDNDMSALRHALQFVPGSDFYKPPAAENQSGPDSASTNSAMVSASQIAALSEIEGKLNHTALMLNSLAGTVNGLRRQLHQ